MHILNRLQRCCQFLLRRRGIDIRLFRATIRQHPYPVRQHFHEPAEQRNHLLHATRRIRRKRPVITALNPYCKRPAITALNPYLN